MAQNRSVPDRDHGSHPAALGAWSQVPDRVDPAMEAMQSAESQPIQHGVVRNAALSQLASRDHPVLASGELGDDPVDWGAFSGQWPVKVPR
jgi:hypothetical protein